METLVDLLDEVSNRHTDRTALTYERDEAPEVWSYRRLRDASEAVASRLRFEHGIPRGARVLTWATNCPELVAAYFGCMRAGIVLVPIDPQSTPEFVARVAQRAEASALIIAADRSAPEGIATITLEGIAAPSSADPVQDRPEAEDLAEIVFTSGTTGDPKGVMLTHANIVSDLHSTQAIIPPQEYRMLSLLPLSHMLEQTGGLYLPLLYGGQVSYLSSRQPATIFKAIREQRVTTMVVVPLVLEIMMRGIEREVRRQNAWSRWTMLHRIGGPMPMAVRRLLFTKVRATIGPSLSLFFCGGARLAPELAANWERMGLIVVEGYGATECAPVVAGNASNRRHFGTVGRPVPGVRVRIAEDGEVQVSGANVSQGYWRNPEATAAAFTSDGWYRTGDLGEWQGEDLVLKGRLRDLIVLPNGMNVYPEDVEAELLKEAPIRDCVVIGRPDGRDGLAVHAVLLPTAEHVDDPNLGSSFAAAVQRANSRLAAHQRMSSHERWPDEDFPRTSSMKIKKNEVRARLA